MRKRFPAHATAGNRGKRWNDEQDARREAAHLLTQKTCAEGAPLSYAANRAPLDMRGAQPRAARVQHAYLQGANILAPSHFERGARLPRI